MESEKIGCREGVLLDGLQEMREGGVGKGGEDVEEICHEGL